LLSRTQAPLISDVLDKIKAGLQYASDYLETAKDIADLVARSLGHKQKQKYKPGQDGGDETKQSFGPSNLVSAFFRLIGFDSQKIVAITINSVVFLAQMVTTRWFAEITEFTNSQVNPKTFFNRI